MNDMKHMATMLHHTTLHNITLTRRLHETYYFFHLVVLQKRELNLRKYIHEGLFRSLQFFAFVLTAA